MGKAVPMHGRDHRPRGADPLPGRLEIKVVADTSDVTTGDGKFIFAIPNDLDGTSLVDAQAYVTTVSSSGTPTVQIRNITQGADMLTTRITIDVSEFTSYTAATPSAARRSSTKASQDG